jgi:hypothetical protein
MEREAEHVRMMDVGRLRLRYASALPSPARKFQLHQHGNRHGLTFVAAENGIVLRCAVFCGRSLSLSLSRCQANARGDLCG